MNVIKKILINMVSFFFLATVTSTATAHDCVILLHGLIRTNHSMSKLESVLKKNHYIVINDTYPSTRKSIKELSEEFIPSVIGKCLKHQPKHIHFVTHSLGGIILREYLQRNNVSQLDRIVMLAPPNHGSRLADISNNQIAKLLFGPSIKELTTQREDIPIKNSHYKIGIIAGNASINPLGVLVFNEPNDGIVPVSSTKMKQMHDFIVLPVTHPFMTRNKAVVAQVLYFLDHGRFFSHPPLLLAKHGSQ